ncbi:MAG TPA: helix-turn-helix domain-containing protein [Myxococcales bacterium]|nr:helix-turn-helix domain-containing protein [Myxococcales bacterium]
MRPLFHPSIENVTVEAILHALADPVRVALFARIVGSKSAQSCSALMTVTAIAVPKSTVSQHFKVLREAGLIRSERRGVEMRNAPRCAEIESRFPGLIAAVMSAYDAQQKKEARARGGDRRKWSAR